MKKTIFTTMLFTFLVLLFSCTKQDESSVVVNPHDTGGAGYFPPKITALVSSDTTFSIYDSITITATAVDSNEDGKVVRYEWAIDSDTFSETSTENFVKIAYNKAEIEVVKVRCFDDDDVVSVTNKQLSLTVTATKPTLDTIIADSIAKGMTLTIRTDGADDADGNNAKIKYIWKIDTTIIDTTLVDTLDHLFKKVGTSTIQVTLIDEDSLLSTPITESVLVTEGKPQVALAYDTLTYEWEYDLTGDTALARENVPHIFTATGTDTINNGTITGYFWSYDIYKLVDNVWEHKGTTTKTSIDGVDTLGVLSSIEDANLYSYVNAEDIALLKVSVQSIDSDDYRSTAATETILVKPYGPESYGITVLSLVDSATYSDGEQLPLNEQLEFTVDYTSVTVFDSLNGVDWYVQGDLYKKVVDGSDLLCTLVVSDTGAFVVEAILTDESYLTTSKSINFIVDGNPPTVELIDPISDSITVLAGETVHFITEWSDVEGVRSDFTWYKDDVLIADEIDSTLDFTFDVEDTVVISVEVMDVDGLISDLDSVVVAVMPARPFIDSLTDSVTIYIKETANFEVWADDYNGTADSIHWECVALNLDTTTAEAIFAIVPPEALKYEVTVTAIDNDGLVSDPETIYVNVKAGLPIITELTADNIAPFINDSITFTVVANDANENGTIEKYLWSFDGVNYDTTTTGNTIKNAFSTPGDVTVLVKVVDNDDQESLPSEILTISVKAGLPTVTELTADKMVTFVDDSITFTAVADDENGPIVSYSWSFDGVNYDTTTTGNTIKNAFTTPGEVTVSVKVTDDDGQLSTSVGTVTVTINSGDPIIDALIPDTTVSLGDSVTLWATARDNIGVKMVHWYDQIEPTVNEFDSAQDGTVKWFAADTGSFKVYVRSEDDDGNFSDYDSVKITVVPFFPAPTLIAPLNGSTSDKYVNAVEFSWNKEADVVYNLYFQKGDLSYLPSLHDDSLTDTTYILDLDSAETYTWAVSTLDTVSGIELFSEIRTVTGRMYSEADYTSADLLDLVFTGLTLSPSLNPATLTGYEVHTAHPSPSSVTVTPTALGKKATLTVNGDAVTSGSSKTVTLTGDITTITIEVTSGNGDVSKSYVVKSIKDGEPSTLPMTVGDGETVTLTSAGSPYVMSTFGMSVNTGGILIIEPGVRILVPETKSFQINGGTLKARGTESQPITITKKGSGNWGSLHFTNAKNAQFGNAGGTYSDGCILEYVNAEYGGANDSGIVVLDNSATYMKNSTFTNSASNGLYALNTVNEIKADDCQFDNNSLCGVKIANGNANVLIINGRAVSNGTDGYYFYSSINEQSYTISNATASNNNGDGVEIASGQSRQPRVILTNFTVTFNGGRGLLGGSNYPPFYTITGGSYSDNYSNGIYTEARTPSSFTGITIARNGNTGLYLSGNGNDIIKKCHIIDNYSSYDNGGFHLSYQDVTMDSCIIEGNTAERNNGAGFTQWIHQFSNNVIRNNRSFGNTGGVHFHYSAKIEGNLFTNNTAQNNYGAMLVDDGCDSIVRNTFDGNSSASSSGNIIGLQSGVLQSNNILDDAKIVGQDFVVIAVDDETFDITNNWWGTSVSDDIFMKLYQAATGGSGVITYSPFLSAPAAEAPATDYTPFVVQ